ncbi:hypothetical protein RN2511_020860 [Rhodococcus sp. NKCM2511]|nr:hypothetical protein RN2511_020860 [Rhodococcus sp. NKCM2511]
MSVTGIVAAMRPKPTVVALIIDLLAQSSGGEAVLASTLSLGAVAPARSVFNGRTIRVTDIHVFDHRASPPTLCSRIETLHVGGARGNPLQVLVGGG